MRLVAVQGGEVVAGRRQCPAAAQPSTAVRANFLESIPRATFTPASVVREASVGGGVNPRAPLSPRSHALAYTALAARTRLTGSHSAHPVVHDTRLSRESRSTSSHQSRKGRQWVARAGRRVAALWQGSDVAVWFFEGLGQYGRIRRGPWGCSGALPRREGFWVEERSHAVAVPRG